MIPPLQPYEGKATQKQKQRLWDLGFHERHVIDKLGKRQASAVIDHLTKEHLSRERSAENKALKSAAIKRAWWLRNITVVLFTISFAACTAEGRFKVYGAADFGMWPGFIGLGTLIFWLRDWASSKF